jgi:hypothetical protein
LAEFYRVESVLLQSGLRVTSDRGVSDEGDPWFVFVRAEDDEVIIHFARISGRYLISAPSYGDNITGHDFQALVLALLERQPSVHTVRRDDNIAWHPSALLVMLVASALLKTNHTADAAQPRPPDARSIETHWAPLRIGLTAAEHTADDTFLQAQQITSVLAAIALVAGSPVASPVQAMVVFAAELPPPVHVTSASTLALDSNADSHPGGAGSLAVTPPSHAAAAPSPADAAHVPTVATWQMPVAPIAGGYVLPADQEAMAITAHLTGPNLPTLPVTASAVTSAEHAGSAPGASGVAASLLGLLGGSEPVLYFDTLPAKLAPPLHESVHVTPASLLTVTHADVSQPTAPAVSQSPAPVSHPTSTASATSSAETTTPLSAGGSGSGHPAAAPAPTPAAAVSSPDLASVLAIMQNFATQVGPHLAVLVSGNQVVEYDYFAVDHTPASVSAVTYDFTDGSHLSLVGLPAELSHAHI